MFPSAPNESASTKASSESIAPKKQVDLLGKAIQWAFNDRMFADLKGSVRIIVET